MAESLFSSPRTFQVWLYTVGHSTLLLRSVKKPGLETRIDVIFKPVRCMNLSTVLDGIDILRIPAAALEGKMKGAIAPDEEVFSLCGARAESWVVSGVVAWHEDQGEYDDPSHFSVPMVVL